MRKFALIAAAVLVAFCGCGKKDACVIKVGSVGPMTGDQAKLGADQTNAVQLAVDAANSAGEIIPGCKLQVYALDDQHDPAQAVSAAKKFAADPDVLAVVGHVNSSCSKPAAGIYDEAGMAQISPSSTNPEISRRGHKTFFRTCATDDIQGPAAAAFAVTALKVKTVYIIDDKTTYGKGLADEFEKKAKELGCSILGHEGIAQQDKDFTPLLTKIQALSPGMLYFGGMYPEGALIVRQARSLGLTSVFMGGDGLKPDDYVKLAQEAAEGSYCTAIGGEISDMETARDFLEAYKKKFNTEPGTFSPQAHDAANIIIEAIRKAGKKDRAAVLNEIRNTKEFRGVLGITGFDERGDTTNKLIGVYRVQGGKHTFVGLAEK